MFMLCLVLSMMKIIFSKSMMMILISMEMAMTIIYFSMVMSWSFFPMSSYIWFLLIMVCDGVLGLTMFISSTLNKSESSLFSMKLLE